MTEAISTREAFQSDFDVSRETMERLDIHDALLRKWNARINLIARGDESQLWRRHFADSAQIWRFCPSSARTWLDLGSGAGFPGLVIAAIAAEKLPALAVTVVESNGRKAQFLQTVVREAGLKVTVLPLRIEALDPQCADVVSARALAPLERLIAFTEKHRSIQGIGLFLKGETVHTELAQAQVSARFEHRMHRSLTDARAAIVEIGAIAGVRQPA